ncbi:MAG: Type 1 glutamine amidotransferase-like domain-containing protein [Porphyromonadaceae bacterium]|nr:Type 1 glutamine amidotransferase-like domain-containing protein [Porphyromonadaceae bacterium]
MNSNIFMFLCSSFADVAPLLEHACPMELREKVVTFIPTASIPESYTEYVGLGREALETLGLRVEPLDVAEASAEEIQASLYRGDLIYISGGNTFYLLQELKRKGADKLIQREIETGKPYIGESAGAMILAPSIEYVQLMNEIQAAPELTSFAALDLIQKYPLPHYQCFPFVEIGDTVLATYGGRLSLAPITNHQAIIVRGRELSIITKE